MRKRVPRAMAKAWPWPAGTRTLERRRCVQNDVGDGRLVGELIEASSWVPIRIGTGGIGARIVKVRYRDIQAGQHAWMSQQGHDVTGDAETDRAAMAE